MSERLLRRFRSRSDLAFDTEWASPAETLEHLCDVSTIGHHYHTVVAGLHETPIWTLSRKDPNKQVALSFWQDATGWFRHFTEPVITDYVQIERKTLFAILDRLKALESAVGLVPKEQKGLLFKGVPDRLSASLPEIGKAAKELFGTAYITTSEDENAEQGWKITVRVHAETPDIHQKIDEWYHRLASEFTELHPGDIVLEVDYNQ